MMDRKIQQAMRIELGWRAFSDVWSGENDWPNEYARADVIRGRFNLALMHERNERKSYA